MIRTTESNLGAEEIIQQLKSLCSLRPEFKSQHPHQVVHKYQSSSTGSDTPSSLHGHTYVYRHKVFSIGYFGFSRPRFSM